MERHFKPSSSHKLRQGVRGEKNGSGENKEEKSSEEQNLKYPPILQCLSDTKASPFKNHSREGGSRPSETIGVHYTPSAANLKIRTLTPPRPPKARASYNGGHGRLNGANWRVGKKKKKDPYAEKAASIMTLRELLTEAHIPEHLRRMNNNSSNGEGSSKETREAKSKINNKTPAVPEPIAPPIKELTMVEYTRFIYGEGRLYVTKDPALPMSPDDQLRLISITAPTHDKYVEPTPKDLHRYNKYVQEISDEEVITWPLDLSSILRSKIPNRVLQIQRFKPLQKSLFQQAKTLFTWTLKKTIVDYILMDGEERKRLRILGVPREDPRKIIRAPVPHHSSYQVCKESIRHFWFNSHPVIVGIRKIWDSEYSSHRIIDLDELKNSKFPMNPSELKQRVKRLTAEGREVLTKCWLMDIANLFADMKSSWIYMVPEKKSGSLQELAKFFSCASSLMSRELRITVRNTLEEVVAFFHSYRDGNDYRNQGEHRESLYLRIPVLTITVYAANTSPYIRFSPSLHELHRGDGKKDEIDCISVVVRLLTEIVAAGKQISRVEKILFPELYKHDLFLLPTALHEMEIKSLLNHAVAIIRANLRGPKFYVKFYEKYLWLLDGTADRELGDFLDRNPNFKNMAPKIQEYQEVIDEIVLLPNFVSLNFISLDCGKFNEELRKKLETLIARIVSAEVEKNQSLNSIICRSFEEMSTKTSERVETTAELVALTNYMNICMSDTFYRLKSNILESMQRLLFLLDYHIFTPDELQVHNCVFHWPKAMREVFDQNGMRLQLKRDQAEDKLDDDKIQFERNLVKYIEELKKYKTKESPFLELEEMKANSDALTKLNDEIQACIIICEQLNEEERLLDQTPSPFPNLRTCVQLIEPYYKLWSTAYDFHKKYEKWFEGPFMGLDADAIVEEVDYMLKLMYMLSKTFSDLPGPKRVADTIRGKIERFRQHLPLLVTICNPGIRERHWEQMSEICGVTLKPTPESTLSDMIDTGISKLAVQLEEISAAATKEFYLEKNLVKMKGEWTDIKFECIAYRETGVNILSALDDIQSLLDDHILKAQTMKGSPFIKPLEMDMKVWEEKLVTMQDILDAWVKVQSTWMYLEPIFTSPDIIKQMPSESRKFNSVDKLWRNVMKHTTSNPDVLKATEYPNMLRDLHRAILLLEEIQLGLNEYLEKKRHFFPRFFFLSNDELLEILSETKDPTRVQPHLKKCFEGIHRLIFTPNTIITAMISAENEVVPLFAVIKPLDAKGMVEKWLSQVEHQMFSSVKDVILRAVDTYAKVPRAQWVLDWPGQVVICGDSIFWTKDVSEAIQKGTLKNYLKLSNHQIDEIVGLVRGSLEPGSRITLGALIVIAVHARDVVFSLNELEITSISDFNWISQLRYYLEDNVVYLRMITTEMKYGYEYLGNSSRLVITPLTDRCYRTLMSAIKLTLGGAPEGPAGTGKTETCKDLAKAVAKQCVVFNCSDGLDYKAMGKFFKGLAQSGSWCVFDEFNRIIVEVLSVVAQQILTIQNAIAAKAKTFTFEETELRLVPTCNIFITMNPGYAGRQELPDNLKVLFRTVAMMVPDYALIGEISLYSMGFVDARSLSGKIVDTYKLCSEQLSSQHHYDYGMRAVKSVLTAAGNLKLKYPSENEGMLVLKAISDVNIPKFLAQDIPLFEGIILDLFPGFELLKPDLEVLTETLVRVCKRRKLQPTEFFLQKTMQIYEMILVRHGLMIVGEALGGKTCAYQCLAAALTELRLLEVTEIKEQKTFFKIINPKAITMGQLYGCFDPVSHEWSDGVLANAFRSMANNTSEDRKWIVFDGPVDAIWIENMNTVLDDNKKLCLMSGEIIQMTPQMNMMFEPADLEQASPATVSRCGMIYMEPRQLGWEPLKESYVESLPKSIVPDQMEILLELLEWLLPPCFEFVRQECKRFVATSELHLFQSISRIYTCMLKGSKGNEDQVPQSTVWIQISLIFAIMWGMASTAVQDSRIKFDYFYRQLIFGNNKKYPRPKNFKLTKNQLFSDKGLCFDYVCDKRNNQWQLWLNAIDREQASISPHAKVNDLIIPTDETSRQTYFLRMFINNEIPFMFVGPTGTGKSAITVNFLMSLSRDKFVANIINFSARTTANQTQDIVMSKLDRRKKGLYGPVVGKKCVIFIDDLSMPQREIYGAQPAIELMRQWIDHGYWFDKKDTSIIHLADLLFVTAMGAPGGGRNEVTPRFVRHLSLLSIDSFDDGTMKKIFGAIVDWHFAKDYDKEVVRWARIMVQATMSVYKQAILLFLPTPAKSHYVFNLRDFSRVIRGLLLIPPTYLQEAHKLKRLWVHEVYRVFSDRLVDDEDRLTFFNLVSATVHDNFKVEMDKLLEHLCTSKDGILKEVDIRNLMFGDFIDPHTDIKIYDEITDLDELSTVMDTYQSEYNQISKTPMQLVLFKFAVEHISRIARVLKQDNGHALLIGIGGSGRQSLTKMAAFMAGYDLIQVEISRTYGITEWREDLKKVLKHAGSDGKQTVFLFADNQIKDESFVEDINMVLNTADIPNIFPAEEKGEILEKMQAVLKALGKVTDTSPLTLYNVFIDRVRTKLHVVLAMSPVGDAFRNRLRMFTSLINCCTIDWFTEWPEDALERVAHKFLAVLDMQNGLLDRCVFMCKHFHESVRLLSIKFAEQLHRKNYVTPTSYLELILTFKTLLGTKRRETEEQRQRYLTGLDKLQFAASQVSVMQDELTALQPILIETSAATEKLMIKIERDTVDVEATKEVVAADEALANEAAAAAQAIKDDCENDLAEAIPALEAAIQALDTLKPADVTVVKSMKNPPGAIKMVLEAICIMRGIKSERKTDQNGKQFEDYWGPSMKMLGDLKFLEGLKEYDKDNIPPPTMKRIREKFIKNPDFDPAVIRNVSTACEGLCKWVKAMEVYDRVIRIVEPKKAKLNEAEGELQAQMDKLNEKRAQLQKVTDKLQALNDEYAAMNKKKKDLEENIGLCSQKLERAEKLIDGLSGEKQRWSEGATNLSDKLNNILGDVLIAAAVVAYLGPFTVDYRQRCYNEWQELCVQQKILCSPVFSLSATLGDPVKIRNWNLAGLPIDTFSIDNAIIVSNSRRWPLMIDPQGQASKWIRNMEKGNKLAVAKLSDPGYLRAVEKACQLGLPVLIDNVGEELDPALEPVLLKQTFKQGILVFIKIGENVVEYHEDFRLFMISRLRNPNYMPEISVKVTLLNFMITPMGLQDQLLGIVAAKEEPALEEQKNRLVVDGVNNKNLLKEIEDKILKVLTTSKGNILEDETAIQILSSSKELSGEILKKQTVAAKTEKKIDETRNLYRPVAVHASTLFFCISELANIDPMYQYSLNWFIGLFKISITNSRKSKDLTLRILYLNDYVTSSVYRNVCRSVFEQDKLVFSFALCVACLKSRGDFPLDVWSFVLTGGVALENPYRNPAPEWLLDRSWAEVVRLSNLKTFQGLKEHVMGNIGVWKELYDSKKPQDFEFPPPWDKIGDVERLALLRSFRLDKLITAVQKFIVYNLGKEFIEPPPFDLASSYDDSSTGTPLIFILSAGSNPMAELRKFAKERGFSGSQMMSISMGQGQGPIAQRMIEEAVVEGGWVVLQNCHLATSWMPTLEIICQDVITSEKTHKGFRLWLTSYPSPDFPTTVLQTGIKLTNEAPQGLRANMIRSYHSVPISEPSFYSSVKNEWSYSWHRMIFGLCFFHALVQERRKFGPLGWNIPYEFNESDLKISLLQVQMFILDYNCIPLDALTYLTGECNYGGRVTDDKDRRLMMSLLSTFYSKEVLEKREYLLSPSGKYFVPEDVTYQACTQYVRKLPISPSPEVFGLHFNANITKGNQETIQLLSRTLLTQTTVGTSDGAGGGSSEQVIEIAKDILAKLPPPFDMETIESQFPLDYMNSMNTVLRQELIRFNRLITVVEVTLKNVQKAIKGFVIMSLELEEVFNSMLLGKVPQAWATKSYPSLKPLGSYVLDLLSRLNFLQNWIDLGTPEVFWLSGFYFTQSFLTGVLQNYARNYKIPIDHLGFEFEVTHYEKISNVSSSENAEARGLFLEGARWDRAGKQLAESRPNILYDILPIVLFKPGVKTKFVPEPAYDSPVYKTSARQGTLSTTGHSTNFVLYLKLKTDLPQKHWINRGAACLCQLDD